MSLYKKLILTIFILGFVVFAVQMINDYYTVTKIESSVENSMVKLTSEISDESQTAMEHLAMEVIKSQGRGIAKQIDLYLKNLPPMTIDEIQNDPEFRKLALQKIGKTGYTSIANLDKLTIAIHHYRQFEGKSFNELSKDSQRLLKIMQEGRSKKEFGGRYFWLEPDGTKREKYVFCIQLETKSKEGYLLSVGSTTYLDEFTVPMKHINTKILQTGESVKNTFNKAVSELYRDTSVLTVVIVLFFLVIGFLYIKWMMVPLSELTEATAKILEGDYSERVKYEGLDELGRLANSFNKMAEMIELNETALKISNEELEAKVAARSAELEHAYNEIRIAKEELEVRVEKRTEELTHANEALKDREETFRALADNSSDTVMRFDLAHRHLYVNPVVEEQTGIKTEDFIGKTHEELGFPEYLCKLWSDAINKTIGTGKNSRIEFQLPSDVWIDWLVMPEFDANGEVKAVITSARDITERKVMEQQLLENEKWLSTTLSSVADAVITTDIESKITFLNQRAELLTGVKADTAIGKEISEIYTLVDERSHDPKENLIAQVLEEKERITTSEHTALLSTDKTIKPISQSGAPIIDNEGNVLGAVLVFRDITKERERELMLRHQQKLESIGTLAGGVAHEINNPINIIMNFGQLILNDAEPDSQTAEDAKEIVRESQRVAEIVRNLLAFSRQDTEEIEFADINNVIVSTLELTEKILAKDGIQIESDLQDEMPKINCKSQQLVQVFMNLLTNARDAINSKFAGKDEKDKRITVKSRLIMEKDPKELEIILEDNGEGIPKSILDRVFDPFFTSKGIDKGTGLGLSISHGIIDDHDGSMKVETKEGEYTRMIINLPVENSLS